MKARKTIPGLLLASAFLAAVSCASSAAEDVDALGGRGYELLIRGDHEAAERLFLRCTRLDKTRPEAWYCLGLCRLEQKKYAASARASVRAAECFEAALSALREGEELRSFMGGIAYADVQNFHYSSLLQAAEAYLLWGRTERALGEFQAVLDAAPADEERILAIAATCIRTGFVDVAAGFFEGSIRRNPGNHAALAPLYLYYAQCQMALGRHEAASHALLAAREEKLKEIGWSGQEDFGGEKARGFIEKVDRLYGQCVAEL